MWLTSYFHGNITWLVNFFDVISAGMPASEKRTKLQRQISDWLENAESVNAKLKMFERDDKLSKTVIPPTTASPGLPVPQQTATSAGEGSSRKRTNIINQKHTTFRSHWYWFPFFCFDSFPVLLVAVRQGLPILSSVAKQSFFVGDRDFLYNFFSLSHLYFLHCCDSFFRRENFNFFYRGKVLCTFTFWGCTFERYFRRDFLKKWIRVFHFLCGELKQ